MKNGTEKTQTYRWIVLAGCAAVVCGILIATLSPFNPSPKNEVSWLVHDNGLFFGDYGEILSSGLFLQGNSIQQGPCSVEIWMRPTLSVDSNSIIDFYTPVNPLKFRIRQDGDMLRVLRQVAVGRFSDTTAAIRIEHVFKANTDVLITVTSDSREASVYLNGERYTSSANFGLSAADFTGRLLIGNSPVANDSWSGSLRGLAFFDRQLTAPEVLQHYKTWVGQAEFAVNLQERPIAIYLFDERAGSVVHNLVKSEPDLEIPSHYFILRSQFLEAPWREFNATWGYWKDVALNIGGFIPLGMFFCAYFSLSRRHGRPVLKAVLVGGTLSLIVETLQGFLPTRDSSMTDVLSNTLGAGLGALFYVSRTARSFLKMAGVR